jgi:hypothetical protein
VLRRWRGRGDRLRRRHFTVNDFRGALATPAIQPVPRLGIAWDASGSRSGVALAREQAFLEALFAKSGAREVALVVFRDRPEAPRTFASFGELKAALDALVYDGGTDLAALAPALAAGTAWFLFSDGLDTLAGAPAAFAGRQVTAVVSQTVADREGLRQACGDAGGCLIDLQRMEQPRRGARAGAPRRVTG